MKKTMEGMEEVMKKITAVLIGAGARGKIYTQYALDHPEELEIVAVAEPNPEKRNRIGERCKIPEERRFSHWEELLAEKKMADAAIICTLDEMHFEPSCQAMDKGYHILLEKPMSNCLEECIELVKKAEETERILSVCHVLRYTPFYQKIKEIIMEGLLGEITGIDQIENVGYWHYAHSFVRGNWRNSKESSPIILAKCCHDLDIIRWLAGDSCTKISSFGRLKHFVKENAPQEVPSFCLDGCPIDKECPYHVSKLYLTDNIGWPTDMISSDLSFEGREKSLKRGNYGRCVYACDNDVMETQIVQMEFQNGVLASFLMSAFTTDMTRQIKVMGTKGQLTGDMDKNEIFVQYFGTGERVKINLEVRKDGNQYGHAGGDFGILYDFVRLLQDGERHRECLSSGKNSLESHLMCFAAEEARIENKIIEIESFYERKQNASRREN